MFNSLLLNKLENYKEMYHSGVSTVRSRTSSKYISMNNKGVQSPEERDLPH